MTKHLPAFANETEEADWWYNHREERSEAFGAAAAEGRVMRGGMAKRLADAEKAKNVVLGHEDAMRAAKLAAEKGVEVQVYLNELMHKAIMQELEQSS